MSQKKTHTPKVQHYPGLVPVSDSNLSLANLCTQGKLEELKRRVQAGAPIEEQDNGNYLTHTAVLANQLEVLKWLLQANKLNVNLPNSANKSVLQIAIESKHVDILRWLAQNKKVLSLQVTADNLCEAVQTKDLEIVRSVAKVAGAVYERSSTGKTPLELARNQKSTNIANFLGKKALLQIIRDKLTEHEILQKLQQHLGDQNLEFFYETAPTTVTSDNTSTVPKKPMPSAVMLAAEKKYISVVKWLVEKGANPNSQLESGSSLLAEIKWDDNPENFKWLVDHGSAINSRNASGEFALQKYVDEDNANIIRWAIKQKMFDVYENNGKNLNLLTSVIQEGKLKIFNILVAESLIDVNKRLPDSNSLLHVAVVSDELDIVKKLIEAKAEIDVENIYGRTPIHIALEANSDSILDLLVISYAIRNIRATDIDENAKIENFKKFFARYNNRQIQEKVSGNEMVNAAKKLALSKLAQFLQANKTASSIEGNITQTYAPKPKEYNVLLIGETGVGKSTFINAFANYISFSNLDEAVAAGDPYCLIPSNFAITDDNYDRHVVTCGELDENETFIAGQSSTQAVKSYSISTEKTILRLIDTPGIGDTRGLERDQENFDKLLKAVAELENIHAICVMLKPNNSRLTVVFEYCIRELFAHLDKSASQNIVFLFTNSRGTFYRPGDTLPPLLTILKDLESPPTSVKIPFDKRNVFCMDNEAFRFLLARQKKEIVFSDDEKADFAESWNKSAQVCRDFVKYLIKLPPHRIQESTTINAARRIVLSLSEPLAKIAEHIDTTTMHLQEKKQFIERNKQNIEMLKKHLNTRVPSLKIQPLKKPFTGCLHKECVQIFQQFGEKTVIPKVCHYPCNKEGVTANKRGHFSIKGCSAMRLNCLRCGHHYSDHIHLYYIMKNESEELKDPNSKMRLDKNISDQNSVEKLKRQLEDVNTQYRIEEEAILSAMAKFSHFLKHNSIIVFHDACKDYIQELIDKEEKLGHLSNKTLLHTYRTILRKYETYFVNLENEFDRVRSPVVTSADIFSEINKLKKLENFGQTIKDVADAQMKLQKEDVLKNVDVKPRTNTLATLMDSIE